MPVALVTGTRHGIGRGTALALAAAGFDIAVANPPTTTAPSTAEGIDEADELVRLVTERGRSALSLEIDLLDRSRLPAVVNEVLATWGRIDVLFSNAHLMSGDMLPLTDISIGDVEANLAANTLTPLALAMLVLPGMVDRGSGSLVFRGSGIGMKDPLVPPGKGGWGMAAAVAKGGLHRIAGVVHNEYGSRGVRAFTVLPGYVISDIPPEHRALATQHLLPGRRETGGTGVVPEAAVANVITWLATADEAAPLAGGLIDAAEVAIERDLHPPWDPFEV